MRSRLCLWAPERKGKTRRKSRAILRKEEKATLTSLIEHNCVYERGGNALCVAQCESAMTCDDDWRLDHHGNLVHSLSGMEIGALEPRAMTSSFEMSQNSNSKNPFLQIMTHRWTVDGYKSKSNMSSVPILSELPCYLLRVLLNWNTT